MKKISFVVPVYNEEEGIAAFYNEYKKVSDSLSGYASELIVVNDGSRDRSEDILRSFSLQDPSLAIISFSRNFGHQIAITAGIDYADGDAVIIMDSDLQDPPEVARELIKKWEEGYEVVYATRNSRKDSWHKKITAALFYKILNYLSDIPIPADTGDFRLMDRRVVLELRKFKEHSRFMRGLSSFVGFKQAKVLFDRQERVAGVTKYPFRKMVKLSKDALTGFSTIPLQIIGKIGFLIAGLSFVGGIYAAAVKIFVPVSAVPGWAFLATSLLFISGVQMITLGIIGSYIGRIYDDVRNRPLYIISHTVGVKRND